MWRTKGTIACKFWGLGGDGTVGANKNSIKIIGDNTDMYVQAYFQYDSKKSGGVTISHLRFGKNPIKAYLLCDQSGLCGMSLPLPIWNKFDIVQDIKPGGTFLLNCSWNDAGVGGASSRLLPSGTWHENNIHMYTMRRYPQGH